MKNDFAVVEAKDEIYVEYGGADVVCRMGAHRGDKNNDVAEREAQLHQAKIIVAALNSEGTVL